MKTILAALTPYVFVGAGFALALGVGWGLVAVGGLFWLETRFGD